MSKKVIFGLLGIALFVVIVSIGALYVKTNAFSDINNYIGELQDGWSGGLNNGRFQFTDPQ